MRKHIFLTAIASLAFTPGAFAQGSMAPAAPVARPDSGALKEAGVLQPADQRFIEHAAMGGMFEVESSELAERKAEGAEVKDFARQMVRDHGRANEELEDIADNLDAQVPDDLDAKHAQVLKKLEGQSGPAFDRTYIEAQRDAHREAVSLFQAFGRSGANPELKQFALKTLPVLQQHMQHVRSLTNMAEGAGNPAVGRSATEKPVSNDGNTMKGAQPNPQ